MDVHHHHLYQRPYLALEEIPAPLDHHGYGFGYYPPNHVDVSVVHNSYFEFPPSYQPPPPFVGPAHHPFAPAPPNDGREIANHAMPMVTNATADQAGGGKVSFRGRGGRRGGRGFGRGNVRGRGRGGGRGQEPAQPPPKRAQQPKPRIWCDICHVDCNSVEILEQHKAGKRHKRTVQRREEYYAQQKQSAGNQATPEVGPSVAANVPQTLPELIAASAPVASEASVSNATVMVEIHEETNKESEAENHPDTERPLKSVKVDLGGTQEPSPSEVNKEDTVPFGKQPSFKRPKPDIYGFGPSRFGRGGRRGGRFAHRGKRPRLFDESLSWHPMQIRPPFDMMPPLQMPVQTSRNSRAQRMVCLLCSVSCDTRAVFETHISGKKHQTRINRCQDPNSVFGPMTVYIPAGQHTPYPQNGEAVYFGLTTPEAIKQYEMSVRDKMGDEDKEEKDAGQDHEEDENLEGRAEGDRRDEAALNTMEPASITVTNAEQSKDENVSAMQPASVTVTVGSSTAEDANQDTKVAANDNDAVPGFQTTSDIAEEVAMG